MKKLWDLISKLCLITGVLMIFQGFGGVAFIREKLGLVTTYATELNEFTLFHPDHLTSTQDLLLEESDTAQRFKEMSSCHQTISTERCYRILKQAFKEVPSFVIDAIYESGYQIMLIGNDIRELVRLETGWDAGLYYDGVTFPGFNGYTQIWSSSQGGKSVLIHEIGHAYDHALGHISLNESFKTLFKSESKKIFLLFPHYCFDEKEFFAESFATYLTKPWLLQTFSPTTFNYFDELLQLKTYGNS